MEIMRKIHELKPFRYYLVRVKDEFPDDKILQEIHAIRMMLAAQRKVQGFSLEKWSYEIGKEALNFAKIYGLKTASV